MNSSIFLSRNFEVLKRKYIKCLLLKFYPTYFMKMWRFFNIVNRLNFLKAPSTQCFNEWRCTHVLGTIKQVQITSEVSICISDSLSLFLKFWNHELRALENKIMITLSPNWQFWSEAGTNRGAISRKDRKAQWYQCKRLCSNWTEAVKCLNESGQVKTMFSRMEQRA